MDQLDHSAAAIQLGDEPSEGVAVDKRAVAGEVAEEIEDQVELAAARSQFGGPIAWGLGALIVVIVILAIATT